MSLSRQKEKLVRRLRNSRMRPREGLVLVEGVRACADVLDAGAVVRFAVVSPALERGGGVSLAGRLGASTVPVVRVEDDELEGVSDTESPQGILLVCEEPATSLDDLLSSPASARGDDGLLSPGEPAEEGGGRFLVLDGVQDPGNAGTLVRAARAFSLDGVVFLDGTVDPWNPKAVRAAAGSSFHLPLVKAGWEEVEGELDRRDVALLVADAAGADVAGARRERPWALVVGNEGDGAREAVRDAAETLVAVPMPGGAESLNAGVAGAVLLYALTVGTGP